MAVHCAPDPTQVLAARRVPPRRIQPPGGCPDGGRRGPTPPRRGRRRMHRVLRGVIASLLLGLACGPTAAPAPAAPAGGASSAAPSAPVSDAAYRQQVIDAARAEGTVNATIQTTFTQETIQRL